MNLFVKIAYLLNGVDGRQKIIRNLRHKYGRSSFPFLIWALHDKHEKVVRAVISELAKTQAPEAVEPLITLLQGETLTSSLGLFVIDALGELRDHRAISELSRRLLKLMKWDQEDYNKPLLQTSDSYRGLYLTALIHVCSALGQLGKMAYQPLALVFDLCLGHPYYFERENNRCYKYELEDLIGSMLQADFQATLHECVSALNSSKTDKSIKYKIVERLGHTGDATTGSALKKLWVDMIQKEGWSGYLCEKIKESVYKICPNEAVEVTDSINDGTFYARLEFSEMDIERFIMNGDRWAIKYLGSTKNRLAGIVLLNMFNSFAETKEKFLMATLARPYEINLVRDILPALANIGDESVAAHISQVAEQRSEVSMYWNILINHDYLGLRKFIDVAVNTPTHDGWDRHIYLVCLEGLLFSHPEFFSEPDIERLTRVPDDYLINTDYLGDDSPASHQFLSYEPFRILAQQYLESIRSINLKKRYFEPLKMAPSRLYELKSKK